MADADGWEPKGMKKRDYISGGKRVNEPATGTDALERKMQTMWEMGRVTEE